MKTAVEWFADEVLQARKLGFISHKEFNELLKQAKKMEEEQRKNDTIYGYAQGYNHGFEGKNPIGPEINNL